MVQRTKEEWAELVIAYRKSGKPLKEWCKENNINYKTMSGNTHLIPSQNATRSDKEWCELIKEQKASGMSRSRWCKEKGIVQTTMITAEKRLSMRMEAVCKKEEVKVETDFPEVEVNELHAEDSSLQKEMAQWIEVGVNEMLEENVSQMIIAKEEEKGDHLFREIDRSSKIIIRSGSIEIEADAGYPFVHLEQLIGKLVKLC